jgi:hypothetical protein
MRQIGGAGVAMVLLATLGAPACERLPTSPARTASTGIRSITFADWTANGYAGAAGDAALDALAATGARTVTILITAYQPDVHASAIRLDDSRTPSPGAVRHVLARARALGLDVALKLHVDLDDGTWRGAIVPAAPSAWFDSYQQFVLPWAALAESVSAVQFVVGTELAGTLKHGDEWRAVIRSVRAIYSGPLAYAASWDEASRVPFWSDLDQVGVDFYFPVAQRRNAGRLELLAGWQPWIERLRRLQRQSGKPIFLTEIGYRSVDGAGMSPYTLDVAAPLDLGEQADLYWAALEATADAPWISGLSWWNWRADGSGGPANTDYTPYGKLAATELAAAWGGPAP